MKEKTSTKKRRAWLKGLIIAEIVVSYMAVLTVVSHARGPEKYRVNTDVPLLKTEDFLSFRGEEATGSLRFENDVSGTACGYTAELQLEDLEEIYISFQVNCREEYVGSVLYIDLYNFEAGYDSAEQEVRIELGQGFNQTAFTLKPGATAPDRAQLRFFTLDPSKYSIQNLQICRINTVPKVSGGLMAAVVFCIILLITTSLCWYADDRKNGKQGNVK